MQQPTITTKNLLLRPFTLSDANRVQLLAGHPSIAEMTENIPHPYADGMAESWIESLAPGWQNQKVASFAVCTRTESELIGCCGLQLTMKYKRASLGYWIGTEYWGNGYCTEAAMAVITFGFDELALHRIEAQHLTKNPASGAVMRKAGMKHEATLTDYVIKSGQFENMELYSVFS